MTSHKIQHCQTFEWAIARGWPLLPCHPRSKAPLGKLVPNGVHDATTDRKLIADWLAECPDANWAVACGAPGPQVLDIDNLETAAVPRASLSIFRSAPRVKTGRGWHLYFVGTAARTVTFEWGELRGVGSYVLVPPSVHPAGAPYRWQIEARGPLPQVPVPLTRTERSHGAGRGDHSPPPEAVPYGQRHYYMKDFMSRLLRAGFTDRDLIERHLICEFERICAPDPPREPGGLEGMARWAAEESRIAERERGRNA